MTWRLMGLAAAAIVVFAFGIMCGTWATGGERLYDVRLSPDRAQRLEFYYPNRWQRLRNPNGDVYVFARLTRVPEDELLGQSEPFDMSGDGAVSWERDRVQIGTSAVYDRATRDWKLLR